MENTNNDDVLYNLMDFYQNEIQPFKYTYNCMFGLNIDLTFEPDEICHLIFGTVKDFYNSSSYKGLTGYNKILNKEITTVPPIIKDQFESKSEIFYYLPRVLANPNLIYFNNKIVKVDKVKGFKPTRIDADFLIFKEIDNLHIHLFLKWSKHKKRLVPFSLVQNKKDKYRDNQIELSLLEKPKIEKR